MRYLLNTICLVISLVVSGCAQDVPIAQQSQSIKKPQEVPPNPAKAKAKLPADQNKYAVIITGIGGEEIYVNKFAEWTTKLRDALTGQLGFDDGKVYVLTEKPGETERRASAEVVRQVFVELKNLLKPDNQLFIFFIGHGSFVDKVAKFNLAGPDLTVNDYASIINALPTRHVVLINTASASGEFVKSISGENRVIVTATRSGMEQNATKFPEHFIAALGNPEADADKNGRISVLESFEYAVKLTKDGFKQKGILETEHALIEDNGDGKGHEKAEEGDGTLARVTYFDSLPQQQAGGDAALAKLFSEKMRLEGEIEKLKGRKAQLKEEDFENELEKLLVELAQLNQNIKAKQKQP